jgi:hypothetical protein
MEMVIVQVNRWAGHVRLKMVILHR